MDIRPSLQIQVAIRAMEQTVLPAVDPNDRIATEQAGLVLAALRVLEQRVPIWRAYQRDELQRLIALSDRIARVEGDGAAELRALADHGRTLFASAEAEAPELEAAVIALRGEIGALIASREQVHRTPLGKLVLEASKVQLERERAWLVPFGFETESSGLRPIEEQLSASRSGSA